MQKHELSGNPNQRVGLLEVYMTSEFVNLQEYDAYFARLRRFWDQNTLRQ